MPAMNASIGSSQFDPFLLEPVPNRRPFALERIDDTVVIDDSWFPDSLLARLLHDVWRGDNQRAREANSASRDGLQILRIRSFSELFDFNEVLPVAAAVTDRLFDVMDLVKLLIESEREKAA